MKLASKVVNVDSKIIISLPETHCRIFSQTGNNIGGINIVPS
jgi:hypothetical protein